MATDPPAAQCLGLQPRDESLIGIWHTKCGVVKADYWPKMLKIGDVDILVSGMPKISND
jgi:hypothetical protein